MEHVYKVSLTNKFGLLASNIIFGGAGFYIFFWNNSHNNYSISLPLGFIWVMMSLFSASRVFEKVTLADSAIERRTLFKTRRLGYDDIADWKVAVNSGRNGTSYALDIIPKDTSVNKPIRVSAIVKIDAFFKNWVMGLPNLTLDRAAEKLERYKNTPEYAAEAAAVQARLDMVEKSSFLLNHFFLPPRKNLRNFILHSGIFDADDSTISNTEQRE